MDATYFEKFCLICFQDNLDGYTQLIRFTENENYLEMKEDLESLIKLGIQIESITTDGHKSILKANTPTTTNGIEGFFSHLKKPFWYLLRINN